MQDYFRGTQDSMIVAGAGNIVKQLLTRFGVYLLNNLFILVSRSGVRLAEPVMLVEVNTEQELVGTLVQDIINRRGTVLGSSGIDEVSLCICILTHFCMFVYLYFITLVLILSFRNLLHQSFHGKYHHCKQISYLETMVVWFIT